MIVGGGFAGLTAAKALRHSPVNVRLVDRTNHHLFQPLLYQVATAVLNPGQIASPLRDVLGAQANATVLMAEVVGVEKEKRRILANAMDRERVPVHYDYLILATGATHSYFGRNEFAEHAPGLKTLADAVAVRNKILRAFEQAEAEEDPKLHRDLLTFVLVGGGPAGSEMAGAISVMIRNTLRTQFRRIDPTSARIVLVDRSNRVLKVFGEDISTAAKGRLERLGVEVRLGQGVDQIDDDGVVVGGERIATKTVIWTAGVAPSPAGRWLNVGTDHAGRVRVQEDLTVPGFPEIFVVGDTASIEQDGEPLGGLAQVAIQGGRYAATVIQRRVAGKPAPAPFRYFDKGMMAVVGEGYAVLQSGKLHVTGTPAWLAWAAVHIHSLGQAGLKWSVFLEWMWLYFTGQRGARLIVDHYASKQGRVTSVAAQ